MPAGFPPLPSVTVETGSGAALLVSDPAARGISLAIAHSASPWRPLLPDSDRTVLPHAADTAARRSRTPAPPHPPHSAACAIAADAPLGQP